MEESRLASLVIVLGGLGMAVFFGCLIIYGEVKDSPQWLVYPAFALMLVGFPLNVIRSFRHDGRRKDRSGAD